MTSSLYQTFLFLVIHIGLFSMVEPIQGESIEAQLASLKLRNVKRFAVGKAEVDSLEAIPCWSSISVYPTDHRPHFLVIAGVSGDQRTTEAALNLLKAYDAEIALQKQYRLTVVPAVDLQRLTDQETANSSSHADYALNYPPAGTAYSDSENAVRHYLWRFIGSEAPDLVILVSGSKLAREELSWSLPAGSSIAESKVSEALSTDAIELLPHRLVVQLDKNSPVQSGSIPAILCNLPKNQEIDAATIIKSSLSQLVQEVRPFPQSPARQQSMKRLKRSPLDVLEQLSKHYGNKLDRVQYIPSLALVAKLRLAELTDRPELQSQVKQMLQPYVSNKKTANLKSGSDISGHLVFAEMAQMLEGSNKRQAYITQVLRAADLGFSNANRSQKLMPFHNEMSDAVFMSGPILAEAGNLTGDAKYYKKCVQHIQEMQRLCFREDHLFRHSPIDEAAWGRGNGFPALGLAWVLSRLPESEPGYAELLESYQQHMQALLQHQDATGMWHQVIDKPGSYREFTSTCMITWAMIRGVKHGWLDPRKYQPAIDKAWRAINTRIGEDGVLLDVCTGTGKQKNLLAYYHRKAILGKDDRGGAMAMMLAIEMASSNQK